MNVQDRETYPADFPWDGSFRTDDVQRLPWWPYRPLPGRVDALWLLGEDASVEGTFGRLVEGWGSSSAWFAAGSSLHAPGSETASWTRAHPDLAVELVGRMTLEGAGPFARSTEWWRLRPTATGLLGLLQGPLLHPRQGWWLAAAPDPEAGPRFLRATTGLLWWSTRDYRPHEGRTHEVVDDSVKEALLGLLPQVGLVSVVPLNNHPVPGVVLFGTPEAIDSAAASIGGVRTSDGAEVEALLARGGWLATG